MRLGIPAAAMLSLIGAPASSQNISVGNWMFASIQGSCTLITKGLFDDTMLTIADPLPGYGFEAAMLFTNESIDGVQTAWSVEGLNRIVVESNEAITASTVMAVFNPAGVFVADTSDESSLSMLKGQFLLLAAQKSVVQIKTNEGHVIGQFSLDGFDAVYANYRDCAS